ncbi:Uncharacterized protein Rs2_35785 [Raphanus sativus]|nr:Uncharacterized protein Rs2_35785 [Raphanus sativus]
MIRPCPPGPVSLQYITIYGLQGRAILGLLCTSRDNNIDHKVRPCASCTCLNQVLSHTSSIDKIHSWVAPSSLPWNFHGNSFCTASTFKTVHAFGSGVWPSPFYSDHLRVSLRHIGSLGCVHP